MTVCNQNRVHCGLLKGYMDSAKKQSKTKTQEELHWLAYMHGLYHLNGCRQSAFGADEIKNQVEKGKFHI